MRLSFFIPAAAYMGLIFFLSSHPAPEPPVDFEIWMGDKLIHIVEYGGLAMLLNLGFFRGTGWPAGRVYVWTFILTVAYGASDELHQSFVPARSATASDVLADAVGAFIYVWLHPRAQHWSWLQWLRFRAE